MPITALPGISGHSKRSTGRWNATGTKCFAAGAGQAVLRGMCSTRSSSGNRYCDQSFISPTGSYKLLQCCEPSFEERSAGKPHATFCGNRRWATASGDPVGVETEVTAGLLRHRQTKEAETDRSSLKPPRHTSTLPPAVETK